MVASPALAVVRGVALARRLWPRKRWLARFIDMAAALRIGVARVSGRHLHIAAAARLLRRFAVRHANCCDARDLATPSPLAWRRRRARRCAAAARASLAPRRRVRRSIGNERKRKHQ